MLLPSPRLEWRASDSPQGLHGPLAPLQRFALCTAILVLAGGHGHADHEPSELSRVENWGLTAKCTQRQGHVNC
jgi:hypothetical protein